MSEKPGERGFLNRWSERKQQIAQQETEAAPADESNVLEPAVPADSVETVDESLTSAASASDADSPILTDDDMPPVDSLSSDSDLSGFFNEGVSAALRKAALRHVFQQPQFNIRDGLNDYDGDYTVFEPLGDIITSDMKWHTARKERARLEAQALELEEQERLALEQQALESQEPEPVANDEEQADERDVDEQEVDEQETLKGMEEEELVLAQADQDELIEQDVAVRTLPPDNTLTKHRTTSNE